MGLARRNKSGRDFGGSKLNVPGQGIFTVVRSPNDKSKIRGKGVEISGVKQETPIIPPNPIPSSTPTVTPTTTPTPTVTPTTTPTPTVTPTTTPTPTPSIECLYISTESLDNLMAENGDYLVITCSP